MNTQAKSLTLEVSTWTDLITNELMRELKQLRAFESIAQDGHDPEGIHGMRVAMRRLRAVAMVFPKVFDQPKEIRAQLRWIATTLGRVRDLDLILENWPNMASSHRLDQQVAAPIVSALERLSAAERHEMLIALESDRYHLLPEKLLAFQANVDVDHRRKEATRALRLIKKKLNCAERKTKSGTLASWHELRKVSKRLRYALEFLEPVIGKRAQKLIRVLRNAQDQLGKLNDLVVTRAILSKLGTLEPHAAAQRERLMSGHEREIRSAQRECAKTFRRTNWRKSLRQIIDRLEQ